MIDDEPTVDDMEVVVVDEYGSVIKVGSIAVYGAPHNDDDPHYRVTVTMITDPDGDVDDEGRGIMINPNVICKFANGDEEVLATYVEHSDPSKILYGVSDLRVITNPIEYGTLDSEGNYAKLGILSQDDVKKCPHYIIAFEHFRSDGSCRCNDPDHSEMIEWEYTWDAATERWQ